MRWGRGFAVAALSVAATIFAPAAASGALGDLDFAGCISGETASDEGTCTLIPDDGANGDGSGLDGAESVAVSRDGEWVYAVAPFDDSIARFRRKDSGALTYKGCLSGDTGPACAQIPDAGGDGTNTGLDDVRALALSRDGRFAYAVSAADDAVVRFRRDPDNGKLRFGGCITGRTQSGPTPAGSGACAVIDSHDADGANSGLDHPKSILLSGRSLYVAATSDASVARFKVGRDDGRLSYRECITGETGSGSAGSGACTEIEDDASNGANTGLDDARSLALANRGRNLFGVSSDDDALFGFQRDRDNGKLTYSGCLSGESETLSQNSACISMNAASGGENSGLDGARTLAVKDSSLYTVSRHDAAVFHFVESSVGTTECYSADVFADDDAPCLSLPFAGDAGLNTGLQSAESGVVSRDGKSLYVSGASDAAVNTFRRNRETGALIYKGCITGELESGPMPAGTGACTAIPSANTGGEGDDSGLGQPQFMALSRDGKSLYAAVRNDDAVAHFRRER
jgi:6-phosphogluconolactonase (cycloisomerase 2 family)